MKEIEVYDWVAEDLEKRNLTVEQLLDFYDEHNEVKTK